VTGRSEVEVRAVAGFPWDSAVKTGEEWTLAGLEDERCRWHWECATAIRELVVWLQEVDDMGAPLATGCITMGGLQCEREVRAR